ncbi:hypothetical protein CO2235_MP80316 [Cupriavidus oxalaticus]|uniref:Uncharacterized protein n=1 Tax=Cupriavidus oxalaticus TaxID=96344 RepID=A0A375GR81_9BURK|nr:hypothetical protein CO2235_U770174 [Cupriavidus oxalaticus]SPC24436.1 hypothetical protein CO2235_MP80316 [Cupriavidus oxalaticus]
MIAFLDVVFECHPCRLCYRNTPRFAELRFPDGEYPADEVNVGPVEPKRFAWSVLACRFGIAVELLGS